MRWLVGVLASLPIVLFIAWIAVEDATVLLLLFLSLVVSFGVVIGLLYAITGLAPW